MNAISLPLHQFAPCALASRPGGVTSHFFCSGFPIRELLVLLLLLVATVLPLSAAATTTTAQNGLSCAGARATTSCTAGEFVTTVTISSQSGSCVSGGYYTLTGDVKLNAPNTDRYDIGFFVGENGNAPEASTTVAAGATCSVATFPTTPLPWFSSSSNTCGDFKGSGSDTPTVQNMKVYCQADINGLLAVPYVLTYTQDSSGVCTGPSDVKVGNSSKCNKGTASVSGVTVLPAMTKTNNVSSRVLAGTTTSIAYTVGFSNLNAAPLSAEFTDPPPSGFTVSSITCSSTPSGNCPAACSSGTCSAAAVTAITQGGGLAMSIPAAINTTTPGRLSFVINGSYAAPSAAGTFTNTAKAVVNGYSQTASDTITVVAAPTVAKAFNQTSIQLNGTARLTITLSNSNPVVAISSAAFTDAYPSGLKNAATPNLTNSCGGTATATAGGTSLILSGGSLAANSSCAVSVDVTSATAGTYTNNTGAVSTGNAGSSTGSSATLVVMAPPTVSESFIPSSLPIYSAGCSGCTGVFAVTLTNSNSLTITGAAFADSYSSTSVMNVGAAGWTCTNGTSGAATAVGGGTADGASSLAVSGLSIPANGSCTVSVTVKGMAGGIYYGTNTGSGTAVTTTNAGSATAPIRATLEVKLAAPTVEKSFSPSVVGVGGVSTLTITLSNPSSTVDITGATFTDAYPLGMMNNGPPATTCVAGSVTAPTASSLQLSGATILAGRSCTVSVPVKATTTGNNSLPIGAVTSTNAVANSVASSATLYVAKTLLLTASPSTVPNDGVTPSAIMATITDPAGAAVPGDTVTLICDGSALPKTQSATTGNTGQAGFAITDTQMETVTCTATDSTGLSASVAVTFSSVSSFNAIEVAADAISGHIYTKLAGTAFGLDVVAIAGNRQASSFSGNVKLELLANTGAAGSGYGSDNCPTSAVVVQTIASTALAGGRSTVSFAAVADAYQDVRVRISYLAATPPIIVCSTDNFAIKPAGLVLWTDAYAGWVPGPSPLGRSDQLASFVPSATATPVVKAGREFRLYATTATGTNYSGALTLDSSKLSAQETSQVTSQQGGGVVGTLTPTSLTVNSQTEAKLAANSGIAANASYSEVGYLYLAGTAFRDAGFTSVDGSSDCIQDSAADALVGGKYGCLIGNTASLPLGRFIPDHFGLTGSVTTRSDITITDPAKASSFTYMDEPMKFALTVTAYRYVSPHGEDSDSDRTQNYAGKFAKLDAATLCNGSLAACGDAANYRNWFAPAKDTTCPAGSQCMGLGAVSGSKELWGRLALDIARTNSVQPTSSWTAGVGTFTANIIFKRDPNANTNGPDSPYMLQIGGKPLDSDGVTLPPLNSIDTVHCVNLDLKTGAEEATCKPGDTEANLRRKLFGKDLDVRFGRLRLSNAFGSEKQDLQMYVQAQYWSGKSWVLNKDDKLTELLDTAFVLPDTWKSLTSASAVNLAKGGYGWLTLKSPGTIGSVDVAINLGATKNDRSCLGGLRDGINFGASLPWLRSQNGPCENTYDRDPSARATFGIYSAERKKTVHIRELY